MQGKERERTIGLKRAGIFEHVPAIDKAHLVRWDSCLFDEQLFKLAHSFAQVYDHVEFVAVGAFNRHGHRHVAPLLRCGASLVKREVGGKGANDTCDNNQKVHLPASSSINKSL